MSIDPLKDPNNGKVTVVSQAPAGSFAAISNISELKSIVVEGQSAIKRGSSLDPVGHIREEDEMPERFQREVALAAGLTIFAVGDKIYDKKHKLEGTIRKTDSRNSQAYVKGSDGEKRWVKYKHLAGI